VAITDRARLARSIHQDVDDLDAVRRSFGVERVDIIGHSYVGVTAVLAPCVIPPPFSRVLIIAPMGPRHSANYKPPLSNNDDTVRDVFARLRTLESERAVLTAQQFCEKFWSVLREIYVTDPANAHRIKWARCDLPNERSFMTYWAGFLMPSLNALALTLEDFARVTAPVLIVHGTLDPVRRMAAVASGRFDCQMPCCSRWTAPGMLRGSSTRRRCSTQRARSWTAVCGRRTARP
jgi:pimeloyl-ACP methyl ester carboxylesterase